MSNELLRATWDVFHAMPIQWLRLPLTHFSSTVKQQTGVWFHPATWQTLAALLLAFAGYWIYVSVRGAKS